MTTIRRYYGVIIASFTLLHWFGEKYEIQHKQKQAVCRGRHKCIAVVAYAFFRRAMPTRPSRPEPNSQTDAGTGTVETVPLARTVPLNEAKSKPY